MIISHKKKITKSGFTLLELLVVIAIIAILIVAGIVAYSTAQKKGRDARRRSDMKAWQDGFEQFYTNNNSAYTNACSQGVGTYFPQGKPIDPANPTKIYYCGATATTYCVCASLDDTTSGNSGAECAGMGATKTHYCLTNLQ